MEENSRVFVDSNYFVALFNPHDALHKKSLDLARALDARESRLIISNLVFLEVVTVLSQRRGKKAALKVGEYLLSSPRVEVVHVDEELNQSTWNIFKEVTEKDVSFVDCSIIAILKAENIADILTFDTRDFHALQKRFRFSFYRA